MKATVFLLLLWLMAAGQQKDKPHTYSPPGKLVDVGGYRLHLNCVGSGGPMAVLIAGGGDFSLDWSLVQPGVSRFTRVCSYDRAGLAWSDPGPTPRTMRQEAYELHTLLKAARIKAPYVLVGHSIGGLIARVYAEHYPDEVAGMILVDPTHEDTILMYQGKLVRVRDGAKGVAIPPVQTMQSSPPNPPTAADIKQFEFNRKLFGAPKTEPPFDKLPATMQAVRLWFRSQPPRVATAPDFWAEELQAMYTARAKTPHQLGDKPLVVILAKSGIGNPPPGISAEEWKRVNEEKRQQKVGLTDLSRNSKLIVAERSGHHIQLDEPQVVTDAVLLLISAVRNETKPGANTLEHIPEPKMEEIRRIRRVDWPNPIVVVNSDSFYLIMFVHGERVQEELNLADLEKTLMELKLDRWPLGRVVVVQENGLRNPGENEKISAKAKEVKQMLELHRVMIELWPSG